jgi:dihydroorotate dehydrogenase electron transfer subunit
MIKKVVEICDDAGLPCQAALERYMKCGIGVCGQCDCDGRLVCRDGPVFGREELAEMPSFGRVRRTATGEEVAIESAE